MIHIALSNLICNLHITIFIRIFNVNILMKTLFDKA